MTKIITRYFESADSARLARHELIEMRKFSPRIVELFEDADAWKASRYHGVVETDTAGEYTRRLGKGGALLLVRASYKPLGVAQTTRDVAAEMGAVDLGDLVEEMGIGDEQERLSKSLLLDHPRLLTRERVPGSTTYHMADWPIPLISRRKPLHETTIMRDTYMADKPIGHLVPHEKRYGRFPFDLLIPGHKYMANFPFGHIIPGHKLQAGFPFGHIIPGHKYMANFPFGHIIPGHKKQAGFPFGHIIPGGPRMANWPFPLLINGKTGTNALVPGHKYMANFPFGHIVPGHKYMANFPFGHIIPGHKKQAGFPFGHLVPGHKYMAKFPFGHIVPGHKYMAKFPFGHLVPGHKYMANWIWPHTRTKAA